MDLSLAAKIKAANSLIVDGGNLDAINDYFAPDYVAHVTEHDRSEGRELIRRYIGTLQRAFPDLKSEVEILMEGEDRVAWQRTLKGTHQGNLMGFSASGRRIVWRDMATSRFREGLIAEEWVITDLAERLLLARKR